MKEKKAVRGRRNFLKNSAAGLAGITFLPAVLQSEDKKQKEILEKKRKMIYRTLGRTGLKLPIISIGAQADNPNIYSTALDAGLVHLDTANGYGNGNHEIMLGKIIKDRSRDSFVVATKVYVPRDDKTGLVREGTKAEPFVKSFETSLKRLGLDFVDILYIHSVVRGQGVSYEPILSALQKLKKEGKTKFIGVSTHTNEPEVIRACADSKVMDVVLTAYNFRQPHLKEVESAIAYAVKAGLGIVAMKTQAGVFWDRERKHQINMKAALKWAFQNENIHTAIPGFKTFDEFDLAMSVMEDLTLTSEEKADLKLDNKLKLAGLYCAQCRKCIPQCKANLDIPTLMRSYMYVYGYKKPSKAAETLKFANISNSVCDDCLTCHIDCTMGFDIKKRVKDIARLKEIPAEFLV